MADLTKLLGETKSLPTQSPEQQLTEAMARNGLTPPREIILDGKLRRFSSGTKGKPGAGDKSGWYVGYSDGIPAGRFGDWRTGFEMPWKATLNRDLTPAEEMMAARRIAEARTLREAEEKKKHEQAAETVETIWQNGGQASADHPYLTKKNIETHSARVTGDGRLMLPVYSDDGELQTLQYIDANGEKRFHPGGKVSGGSWYCGTDDSGVIYVAEGFATSASISEVTNAMTYVAYSASNIPAIVAMLRARFGTSKRITVVADNDSHGVGKKYADIAAKESGSRTVMIPIEGFDANDYLVEGNDLRSLLVPQSASANWLIPADELAAQPSPISWLIKGWIQRGATHMIHGASGAGKSFAVLDMCMRIAAKYMPERNWFERITKPGNVIYLAGEGHHGIRGRVAAWKQHHDVDKLNMWISSDGCDLNTPEGLARTVDSIGEMGIDVDLIVIDTLHRFMHGDENSAQDAKSMLDSCAYLTKEFESAVLLVHHTGVSTEAQNRARGSSAWKGAMDVELNLKCAENEHDPIELRQMKLKDGEMQPPKFFRLQSVAIKGWVDEDGEQVNSAVVDPSEPPAQQPKQDSKIVQHRKAFENAWWFTGMEEIDGKPYVTRSGMIDYLIQQLGLSESSAKAYVKPSVQGKPIAELLINNVIERDSDGWVLVDEVAASALLMQKMAHIKDRQNQ